MHLLPKPMCIYVVYVYDSLYLFFIYHTSPVRQDWKQKFIIGLKTQVDSPLA